MCASKASPFYHSPRGAQMTDSMRPGGYLPLDSLNAPLWSQYAGGLQLYSSKQAFSTAASCMMLGQIPNERRILVSCLLHLSDCLNAKMSRQQYILPERAERRALLMHPATRRAWCWCLQGWRCAGALTCLHTCSWCSYCKGITRAQHSLAFPHWLTCRAAMQRLRWAMQGAAGRATLSKPGTAVKRLTSLSTLVLLRQRDPGQEATGNTIIA